MNQELDRFLKQYEIATNTHDFDQVAPLIAESAIYWFSDGSFVGISEIKQAFIDTWDKIKDEEYHIDKVQWISYDNNSASCIYQFHWEGIIDGEKNKGSGRGTNIVIKIDGQWKVLHEHLSI